MTCNCGHPRDDHRQHDDGVYCYGCMGECTGQEKTAAVATVHLSAGVTPEGLAEETIADDVNEVASHLAVAMVEAGNPSQYPSVGAHARAIVIALRRQQAVRLSESADD